LKRVLVEGYREYYGGRHPEVFDEVLNVLASACKVCEHFEKGYSWKIIPSIFSANPDSSIIRIETDIQCAAGKKIQLYAKDLVRNPLSLVGRCPENQCIPVVNVREEDGKKYIEEIGGCGRVIIRKGATKRTVNYGADYPEREIHLPMSDLRWSPGEPTGEPTLLKLLETYKEFGWLSPEKLEQFTES